jgi:hypothetical protein
MNCALAPALLATEDIFGNAEKPISKLLFEAADEARQEIIRNFRDNLTTAEKRALHALL